MIKHNPRTMYQDEAGEWWYRMGNGTRARCEVRMCQVCAQEYVTYPSHKSWSCSRTCARKNALRDPNIIPPSRKRVIGWSGEQSPHWRGGKFVNKRGYVMVWTPEHPACQGNTRKYVGEHRLVMEEQLGRLLKSTERVHHKNGVKTDNRPENLELWQFGHPAGQRIKEREPMIQVPLSMLLVLLQAFTITVS